MSGSPGDGKGRGSGRPSPFAGHHRRGKRHLPALLDFPIEPTIRPFRKVAFPDFLWLLTMLRNRPLTDGAWPITGALDAGQAAFHRAFERGALVDDREPVFHGLLTDWELIPNRERGELLGELRRLGIYEAIAPEALAQILAAYEDAPGRWLVQARFDAGLTPELIAAEEHLWETMRLGGSSHHELATHAIFVWLRGSVMMRRIHWPAGDPVFELFPRYPMELDEPQRKAVESTLRASFLSNLAADAGDHSATAAWCERFWRDSRRLFRCIVAVGEEARPPDRERARARASAIYRLHYRFLRASDDIDPNLWDHDRYDVLTGVAWRILRTAAHLVAHPLLWSEEHGYPSVRMLVEAYVQMRWMVAVEDLRPGVWHEFKNYGRGRNKALLLHTEEVLSRSEGEPRAILERLLPRLKEQANRDIAEDFQDIIIADSFAADTSLLAMARTVGLEDMYHSTMIPASSALHGDWSALDEYVLVRCGHPLHDAHAVPRAEYAPETLEQFPELAERLAGWAFEAYCAAMAHEPITDKDAEAEMRRTVDGGMRKPGTE
jgi:hypothetical protein